jgi:hypothetical protein
METGIAYSRKRYECTADATISVRANSAPSDARSVLLYSSRIKRHIVVKISCVMAIGGLKLSIRKQDDGQKYSTGHEGASGDGFL